MCHISWFELLSYRIEPINIYNDFYLRVSSLLGTYLIKQMVWDQVMVFSTGIISVVFKFSLPLVRMKLHSSSYCVTYLRHFVADC